jgi:hypothetical protein
MPGRQSCAALQQHRADAGIGGDAAGDGTYGFAPELSIGRVDLGDALAGAHGLKLAAGVAAETKHAERDRAVEHAGIHVRQAEMAGERAGDGALAAGRGAIDGDDDRIG